MTAANTNYTSIPSAFSGKEDRRGVPMVFQVLSPDFETLLLPDFLVLHVNPDNLNLEYSKTITRRETLGGFVEEHFNDALTQMSASGSTGAFVNVEHGLTTFKREDTIAYRKYLQLLSVFESNGSVYDDRGIIQFQGRIRIVFGGGVYDGFFQSFEVNEASEAPHNFQLSWSFKVVKEALSLVY